MILLSILNSFIGIISVLVLLVIFIGILLEKLRQPYIIGYIIAGILIGEHGLQFIQSSESINHMGELGIILLLFFIGLEISLPEFIKQWKVALIGTLLQVLFSVTMVFLVGSIFGWGLARNIVVGFVIALSSSAVIMKLLIDKEMISTQLGKNILSILLMQDILIVPLLIITAQMGGEQQTGPQILKMILGGFLIIGVLVYVYKKGSIKFPFANYIERDHELQVFIAILFCFGGALISGFFGLSAALGAFVGGMVLHGGNSTKWIHDTLFSFRVLFVAIFFLSIGLQIDLNFILENWMPITFILILVYMSNHLVNTLVLRFFKHTWKEAFLGGAYLAQIGELSFLISFTAYQTGIILEYGYKFTISLISLTLLISPFWILLSEKLVHFRKSLIKKEEIT